MRSIQLQGGAGSGDVGLRATGTDGAGAVHDVGPAGKGNPISHSHKRVEHARFKHGVAFRLIEIGEFDQTLYQPGKGKFLRYAAGRSTKIRIIPSAERQSVLSGK